MRIAFYSLKKYRFVVTVTKKEIRMRGYRRTRFPFLYLLAMETGGSRSMYDYHLIRWVNAGCGIPEAYSNMFADLLGVSRESCIAIINYKY